MPTLATAERCALIDLMAAVGPDAPTLCKGWQVRDLAAHLLIRDRRPDALPGIVVRPLSWWTERVQRGLAARPWPEVLAELRAGPPAWSVLHVPQIDRSYGTYEYFVHHEDVRRAQPGWQPRRALDHRLERALWALLQARGWFFYRRAPVGVELRRDDTGEQVVARRGTRTVTIIGPVQELVLHAFGRRSVAQVQVAGDTRPLADLRWL